MKQFNKVNNTLMREVEPISQLISTIIVDPYDAAYITVE